MIRTIILRTARFRGQVSVDTAAATTATSKDIAAVYLREMVGHGLLRGEETYTLTPAGRFSLNFAIEVESSLAPYDQLLPLYNELDSLSATFDQVISDWRRPSGGYPIDRVHSEHIDDITARLVTLHDRALPLATEVVGCVARLQPYLSRLSQAISHVRTGDTRFIDLPTVDSYFTAWSELNEELVELLRLHRGAESLGGRAA